MPAPASVDRVLAVLRRLQPPGLYSPDPAHAPDRELQAIAVPVARVADLVELLLTDFLPDQSTALLPHWERALHLPTRLNDSLATRRNRVVQILRRSRGYNRSRVAAILAPALDLDPADVEFIEVERDQINWGLTVEVPEGLVTMPVGSTYREVRVPWPGSVDEMGVRLELKINNADAGDLRIVLRHGGVQWVVWDQQGAGSPWGTRAFETHSAFLQHRAADPWILEVQAVANPGDWDWWRLRVSNDVDATQIYYGYIFRDSNLPGTADIGRAQHLAINTISAHTRPYVCQRRRAIVDDALSLSDREPVG